LIRSVVTSEDADALEYWAEAGADFWAMADDNGRTPLHVAAEHNLMEHARVLLSLGADPRRRDANGVTPIDIAAQRKNVELVSLLQSGCSYGGTNSNWNSN
jgi:ankyrin repeat protein